MTEIEKLKAENAKLILERAYLKNRIGMIESSYPLKFSRLIKSFFKNPLRILISPLLFLWFFGDLFIAIIKHYVVPLVYKQINLLFPPTKIAFACYSGNVGGAERVLQMHVQFADEKFKSDIFFNVDKGDVANELRKNHRIFSARVLTYFMLRYKYIYLTQILPNLALIKSANPFCRVSFIFHDHLSGSIELFQNSPDAHLVDEVFFISKFVKDKFIEAVPWFPKDRLTVLYNPFVMGNEDISRVKQKNTPSESFTIGYFGRISPEKNPVGLIRIFKQFNKKHPNTKLILAGPIHSVVSEYGEEMKREIEGEKNIEYWGPINVPGQPTSSDLCKRIDALAFTSFVEGIPLTAAEVMSFGVPVISTKVGAMHEIIHEGENGLLVDLDPLDFNPFVEQKPPFKSMTKDDEKRYLEGLEKLIKIKWDNKKIAKGSIETFGTKVTKNKFLDAIDRILSREPIKP